MRWEGIKCEGICPRVRKVMPTHVNDRVAISNILTCSTCPPAHISRPPMTVPHREEVKGGPAGTSLADSFSHEVSIPSPDLFPSFSWKLPFPSGFYLIIFPPC